MVLSDVDIIERVANDELVIDPYEEDNVEPASVDLRLGEEFKITNAAHHTSKEVVHLSDETDFDWDERTGSVTINRGNFVLATTLERVEIPNDLVASVLGRSSLGRLGISVHQTAGYIDPGFEGQITLELSNHGPAPVHLESGDRICQVVFENLSSPALEPYGHDDSQYQHQSGATPSGMQFE
jgi:dCTP deaminase